MIQYIIDRKIPILNKSFQNTFKEYNKAGFQIQTINLYPEFKPMEDTFKDIGFTMNYATAKEYVP